MASKKSRRRSPSDTSETSLNNSILSMFERFPNLVTVWRNNTGALDIEDRTVRFGTIGSSDILGLVTPNGRFLAIEGKSKRRKLTPDQHAFLSKINAAGGYGVVVRDLQSAWDAMNAARRGERPPPLEEPENPRPRSPRKKAFTNEEKERERANWMDGAMDFFRKATAVAQERKQA